MAVTSFLMNSDETSTEEHLCSTSKTEKHEKSNVVNRPSFVVKRVNENELINQSNLTPQFKTTTNLYEPLSSASSTSSSGELNSYNYPTLSSSNFRKQSIRYSCRLYCHHQHDDENHQQQNNNEKSVSTNHLILPYCIWKKRFMDSHQCHENDFLPTVSFISVIL